MRPGSGLTNEKAKDMNTVALPRVSGSPSDNFAEASLITSNGTIWEMTDKLFRVVVT